MALMPIFLLGNAILWMLVAAGAFRRGFAPLNACSCANLACLVMNTGVLALLD